MAKVVHKFGRNPDVGNGTWEDVWSAGGVYAWPQTAGKVTIRSSTAGDGSAGAGARSVTVVGLSSAWAEQTETIATNGTGRVVGTKNFVRMYRAYVETAGAYATLTAGSNLGTISIRTTSSGMLSQIAVSTGSGTVGFGQTQMSHYTVPAGYDAWVRDIQISPKASKSVDVAFFQRRNADDTTVPVTSKRLVSYYDGLNSEFQVDHGPTPLGPFPAKTDLWWAAKGDGVASAVSVDYEIMLFPAGQSPEMS